MLVVETLTVVERLDAFSGATLVSLAPSVTDSSKIAGGSTDDEATTGRETAPDGFLRILS